MFIFLFLEDNYFEGLYNNNVIKEYDECIYYILYIDNLIFKVIFVLVGIYLFYIL